MTPKRGSRVVTAIGRKVGPVVGGAAAGCGAVGVAPGGPGAMGLVLSPPWVAQG
jgi:hypothetical protein